MFRLSSIERKVQALRSIMVAVLKDREYFTDTVGLGV